ncbi:hypothetical protein A2U01_0073848, partial [Trifolium medium]|nr:hypothetical protein [Trifolium medium]
MRLSKGMMKDHGDRGEVVPLDEGNTTVMYCRSWDRGRLAPDST